MLARNTKNAYEYMKKAEREYHEGKTVIDHGDFIIKINEAHSIEEIHYLKNEMGNYKESEKIFTSGFFNIILPLYVMLFTFVGIVASAVFGYANSLTLKLIDINLEESNGKLIGDSFDLFSGTVSFITNRISIMILFLFVLLLLIFYIMHIRNSKRMKYYSWLVTVLELKKKVDCVNERME